jgi:hypothetical protein
MFDKLITPPTAEPVTADEMRSWLRDVPDSDESLMELIAAAREFIERETGLAIMEQGRLYVIDQWPVDHASIGDWDGVREGAFGMAQARAVELPRAPLASVESIMLVAADGSESAFAPASYYVDLHSEPGRVILNNGASPPIPGRPSGGIKIAYTAGQNDAALISPTLKIGIKQLAAHFYENREAVGEISLERAPLGIRSIIRQFRIWPGI